MGGYGGPAILSRGRGSAGSRGADPVNIGYYGRVAGSYDTGFTPVVADTNGKIADPGGLFGIEASIGAYGTHSWKRSSIGLEYRGNYRHYSENTYYNGSDHILALNFAAVTTRRTLLTLQQTAGTTNIAYGGITGLHGFTNLYDPLQPGLPVNEIFDNRSYFIDSTARLIWVENSRNSFSFFGGGFAVRRHSKLLIGQNGIRAGMDFARRINRRTTLSLAYSFQKYDFPRAFGAADLHSVSFGYSQLLGKNWEIAASGGAYLINVVGTQQVTLDPLIAQLFGRKTGIEVYDKSNIFSSVQGTITRRFKRSTLLFTAQRGIAPGNGVLLTSRNQSYGASFSHSSSRRLGFYGNINYFTLDGIGGLSGHYDTFSTGVGVSYVLRHHMQLMGNIDYRFQQTGTGTVDAFNRGGTRFTLALGFSQQELPMVWH